MNRRDRSTFNTHADMARSRRAITRGELAAVAAYDERRACARRANRVLRLLYVCSCVALCVALFYSATN